MNDLDMTTNANLIWLENLRRADVGLVGGKNSSLGEMLQTLGAAGIKVPPGFATTSGAYRKFLDENAFGDVLRSELGRLADGRATLAQARREIAYLKWLLEGERTGFMDRALEELDDGEGTGAGS